MRNCACRVQITTEFPSYPGFVTEKVKKATLAQGQDLWRAGDGFGAVNWNIRGLLRRSN
jgi:hypothetical protein